MQSPVYDANEKAESIASVCLHLDSPGNDVGAVVNWRDGKLNHLAILDCRPYLVFESSHDGAVGWIMSQGYEILGYVARPTELVAKQVTTRLVANGHSTGESGRANARVRRRARSDHAAVN